MPDRLNNLDTTGRILIADPNESVLLTTADLLRKEGYECAPVRDGLEAIRALEANEYDLMIAEINMPGNEELELVQAASRCEQGMPVIVYTGYPTLRSAIASIQLPVTAYLVKPVEFSVLLDQVKASIANHPAFKRRGALLESFQIKQDKLDQIDLLTRAIQETIQVLEATRSAFKSKQLAALRRKLERILARELLE